ncbi:MAG: signal peptidase I [Candidatus Dojkabacteria bacterium]
MKILKKEITVLQIIFTLVQLFFLIIITLTVLSLFGIPKDLQIFVVETGSMEPNIKTGSLAFVSPSKGYQVGDIITFKSKVTKSSTQNYIVTHRINSIREDNGDLYYTTKGDANKEPDPLETNGLDIIGKTKFSIPYVGYAIGFAKTKPGFLLFIIVPTLIIIFTEFLAIYKEFRKKPSNQTGVRFGKYIIHQ